MSETKRLKMVGWYDPRQLARTGWEVIVSAMFGKHADKRVIQAIADNGSTKKRLYHEIVEDGSGEFWFDYVSDVGDGFDPTYTVAYHLTRDLLPVATRPNGTVRSTKRGDLLIFGGDEVYPTAGAKDYKERLVDVYDLAFPRQTRAQLNARKATPPPVFAIPGNHDWYDSLAEFMKIFCRGKAFCGWTTHQNRSYFALKLPRGWWLFGTDMQLSSSLDDAQMDYFRTIVNDHLEPGDRIILCNAEPYWITDKMYRNDPNYNNRNMGFFEGHILQGRGAVYVAGDRHYYRRHEEKSNLGKPVDPQSQSKKQRFVAGGGGAFLHPTHREGVQEIGRDRLYDLKESYPPERTSFWLTLRNLLFPYYNPYLGIVTAALYLLTAQAFRADLSRFGIAQWKEAVTAVISDALFEPIATFWVVLILLAFYLFTDTHSRYLRFVAGPIHAVLHFAGVFGLGWAAAHWLADVSPITKFFLSVAVVGGGGYILGPMIMAVYLLVMLNVFGVHHNEAFSSIKGESYKNFLRFKIEDNGTLVIYPIGIDQPIRNWKDGDPRAGESKLMPEQSPLPASNVPFLIEDPVRFEKPFPHVSPAAAGSDTESSTQSPLPAPSSSVIEHNLEI